MPTYMTKEEEIEKIMENPTPHLFDKRVHIRDTKGRLLHVQPYRLHIISGRQYFERPKGSGNLFFENGDHAGRIKAGNLVDPKAEHIEYVVPKTGAEKLYDDLQVRTQELEAARAELEAIKKEQKFKDMEKSIEAQAKANESKQANNKQATKQSKAAVSTGSKV